MASGIVYRDFDVILQFCKEFQEKYLNLMRKAATGMKQAADDTSATLGNTGFATNAAETLYDAADEILRAVQDGEDRVRELERKTNNDKVEYETGFVR